MTKKASDMANYVLAVTISKSGAYHCFYVRILRIEHNSLGERLLAYSDYDYPLFDFAVKAQADISNTYTPNNEDMARIYAMRFEAEIGLHNIQKVAPELLALHKRYKKILANSIAPKTFGQNVFLLAKALRIETIIMPKYGDGIAKIMKDNFTCSPDYAIERIDKAIFEAMPYAQDCALLDV